MIFQESTLNDSLYGVIIETSYLISMTVFLKILRFDFFFQMNCFDIMDNFFL